jgi:hypothetical protein
MSFKNHGQSRRFIYDRLIVRRKPQNSALKSVDPEAHAHQNKMLYFELWKTNTIQNMKKILHFDHLSHPSFIVEPQ